MITAQFQNLVRSALRVGSLLQPDFLVTVVLGAVCLAFPTKVHAQSEAIEYYGSDASGSVRIVFDSNGNILGRTDYGPFGQELVPSTGKQQGIYAGLFANPEVAADAASARMYQLRAGRFSSVDPVYNDLFEPQGWNRYTFALNNPLVVNDATGLDPTKKNPSLCTPEIQRMNAQDWHCVGYSTGGGIFSGAAENGAGTIFFIPPAGRRGQNGRESDSQHRGQGALDALQSGLDVVSLGLDATGVGGVVSWIPDAANAGISLARGDTTGAALSAAAMIPFAGASANAARLGKDVKVYLGYKNGAAVYVGITNSIERRAAEHASRFRIGDISDVMPRIEGRAIEQALIERNPGFENIRNSISPNNPIYASAVAWGRAWLKRHGF